MTHEHPEAAEYAAAAPELERAAAPRKFTKDDLVYLATTGATIGIRISAAEALYQYGRADGAEALLTVRP